MNAKEYQPLAMRTSPDGHDRILNGCLGLIGESGEIVDAVKKWKFQSGDHAELPVDKLIDECGDVLWYCAETLTGLDFSMEDVVKRQKERAYLMLSNKMNMKTIYDGAAKIAVQCTKPYLYLTAEGLGYPPAALEKANGIRQIVAVYLMIERFLKLFCNTPIEDAMTRNIEKLRRRYPDGFDPERSLHRAD